MESTYLVNFNTRLLPREKVDFLVIGSGIAGLYTAHLAAAHGLGVVVLTKALMDDSNTDKAQGGIAAAIGENDSPAFHLEDTLAAGAGLCDREAVEILVNEGPDRVSELIEMGAVFDRDVKGLALTREGAHSQRRILHASGDATGAELQRTLHSSVHKEQISVLENNFVVDLLVRENICHGALVLDRKTGGLRVFWADTVVLASGGLGQIYQYNTNPSVSTGDGIAQAFRAGAQVMDMEFVQFHPTVFSFPQAPCFLISEAVRGEGAVLVNSLGRRFMPSYHEMAELAPRDVVARAILAEMEKTSSSSVYLDLSHMDRDFVQGRFPTITKTLADFGLDITCDLIPVVPAAHYAMSGVKTDLNGRTSVERLYACGEVACQGVHGANRLASNSLLDGLVFGHRIAEHACHHAGKGLTPPEFEMNGRREGLPSGFLDLKFQLQKLMTQYAGLVRDAGGLKKAGDFLAGQESLSRCEAKGVGEMELLNMLEVARLIVCGALARCESRGAHYRSDFPFSSVNWQKHIIFKR